MLRPNNTNEDIVILGSYYTWLYLLRCNKDKTMSLVFSIT